MTATAGISITKEISHAGSFAKIGERVLIAWNGSREAALAVTDAPRIHGEEFLFPGAAEKHLSNMALLELLRRMGRDDITVHGFRSTFRDWAAECKNYPREVCEMALAHTVSDAVEAPYRRGDLFEKRRRLMADWASYCDSGRLRKSDR